MFRLPHLKRKGDFMQSQLPLIILTVVIAILLIILANIGITTIKDWYGEGMCKGGISKSQVSGVPDFSCKPVRSVIRKSDFTDEASNEKLADLVKRDIAGRMWECWTMVGKGKMDPYKSTYEVGGGLATKNGKTTIYMICDIISFEEIPNFRGLTSWMTINKPSANKVSYYKYLTGKSPTPDEVSELELERDIYFTSDTYVVAWKHEVMAGKADTPDSIVFIRYTDMLNSINTESSRSVVVN